jgi:HSP20 family molecular chaperone IbpA
MENNIDGGWWQWWYPNYPCGTCGWPYTINTSTTNNETSNNDDISSYVFDNDESWGVELLLPNANTCNMKAFVKEGILEIIHSSNDDEEKGKPHFTAKSFNKKYTLPFNVNVDTFTARYIDGILIIKAKKNKDVGFELIIGKEK